MGSSAGLFSTSSAHVQGYGDGIAKRQGFDAVEYAMHSLSTLPPSVLMSTDSFQVVHLNWFMRIFNKSHSLILHFHRYLQLCLLKYPKWQKQGPEWHVH